MTDLRLTSMIGMVDPPREESKDAVASAQGSVLTTATFDSEHMNRSIIAEFVLAILVTQMDPLRRMLGTTQLDLREWGGRWSRRSGC